jgi:hypothetical protein
MYDRFSDHLHLVEVSGTYFDLATDSVVVILTTACFNTDKPDLKPVVGVAPVITQQPHATIQAGKEYIKVPILIVIRDADLSAAHQVFRQQLGGILKNPLSFIVK